MKSIGKEPRENKPASEQAKVGGWARRPQARKQKKMLTSGQAYSMGYYNKERITI